VDEEMRSKVADTLSRQVYFEKELTMAVGNITEEEEKMEGKLRALEEKHDLDRERGVRMNAHRSCTYYCTYLRNSPKLLIFIRFDLCKLNVKSNYLLFSE
jgi:hypothetical protein